MKLRLSSFSLPLISILILVLAGCDTVETESHKAPSASDSGSLSSWTNKLEVPAVTLTMENNDIYLDWTQSNADQFRVLYWKGNNEPQEQITTSTEYTFPPLGTGSYTVVVEAFDEMGNSLFSVPVALEVL